VIESLGKRVNEAVGEKPQGTICVVNLYHVEVEWVTIIDY
jgi:hypothetical protein